jgi:hypothetical protein
MMKYLQDCIEFAISYYVINQNQINTNIAGLIDNLRNIITMI